LDSYFFLNFLGNTLKSRMKNHLDAWWYIYSNISILKTFVYFVYTETKKNSLWL